MEPDDIVTLREFPDSMLAELARATLDAHGIDAIVARDDCGGLEPHFNISMGAKLRVQRFNADAALEILDTVVEEPA